MKIVIVLPTYNERENIGPLLDALARETAGMPHEVHVLVVDDNSPDGTAEVVRRAMATREDLHLLTGEKKGLGAAYVRGMRHAIEALGAEAVLEMDADFSHRPQDVPRLVEALEQCDFVIGSRYVPGGSIPAEWSRLRRWNSRWGNVFARHVAGLRPVRDCTAGFRAIRASLLRAIDVDTIRVQGYCFQMDLLHRAVVAGARIREIPVDFVDRERGQTKLGLSDIVEFVLNAWWIRLERSEILLKFLLVGAIGVAVNLGTFTAQTAAGVGKYVASPISVELAILSNFLLNNYWTFASRRLAGSTRIKGLRFNAVSLLTLTLSYAVFVLLCSAWPSLSPQAAQAIGIVPAAAVNYLCNVYWTFRDRPAPVVRAAVPVVPPAPETPQPGDAGAASEAPQQRAA